MLLTSDCNLWAYTTRLKKLVFHNKLCCSADENTCTASLNVESFVLSLIHFNFDGKGVAGGWGYNQKFMVVSVDIFHLLCNTPLYCCTLSWIEYVTYTMPCISEPQAFYKRVTLEWPWNKNTRTKQNKGHKAKRDTNERGFSVGYANTWEKKLHAQ